MENPGDYDTRANIMWCATQALNGLIACGVIQDWTSHTIGHELTAIYGLDHARSLAVAFPAVIRHQKKHKFDKFIQYGRRVWHIIPSDENNDTELNKAFELTLAKTLDFFHSLGFKTKLSQYNLNPEKWLENLSSEDRNPVTIMDKIALRISKRSVKLGEHKNIGYDEIKEILDLCWK